MTSCISFVGTHGFTSFGTPGTASIETSCILFFGTPVFLLTLVFNILENYVFLLL